MKNTEKAKNAAKGFATATKVLAIISIVSASITLALAITFFCFAKTNFITTLYEMSPNEFAKIIIKNNNSGLNFTSSLDQLTVGEIYEKGELVNLTYGIGLQLFISTLKTGLLAVILFFIRKIFVVIANSDSSPFTKEIAKTLKISFIAITIFALMSGLFCGIVVGGVLLCLYFIYLYGVELQQNEDTTL